MSSCIPRSCFIYDSEKVELVLKIAEFWQKTAALFQENAIPKEKLSHYNVGPNNHLRSNFSCTSTCYFNAAKSLSSARILLELSDTQNNSNNTEELSVFAKRASQLLKKALLTYKLVDSSNFNPEILARFKEREIELLFESLSLKTSRKKPEIEGVRAELSRKLVKLSARYDALATGSKLDVKAGMYWEFQIKRAFYLTEAAFLLPSDQKEKLLLEAEKIAKTIWREYRSCICHPLFSPEYSHNPEYTLLGRIQIALGHCTVIPHFTNALVVLDC